jgi:hypothetical protein
MARDLRKRVRPRQEGAEVGIVAAMLPGVAVSIRRTGTFGRATCFGNIIVPRIFSFRTFATGAPRPPSRRMRSRKRGQDWSCG